MNPVTNASGMNDTPSRVTYFNTNPNPTRHKIPILMTERSLTCISDHRGHLQYSIPMTPAYDERIDQFTAQDERVDQFTSILGTS